MLLDGKTAVVTGCGGGLGLAIARTLAVHGARIVAMDRSPERADEAARELLASTERQAIAIAVDVSSAAAVAEAFAKLDRHQARIDILVNCAGIREVSRIYDLDPAEWERVIAVNLSGPFYVTREAALRMRETGGGSIVNVASVAGIMGLTHRPAYTASKHGLVGLTRNLARDLAGDGIRVNAVAPGTIRTPMTEGFFDDEGFRNGLREVVPLGDKGSSDDVANAVLFLASPLAGFVNGVVLPVDGGWSAEKAYTVGGGGNGYTAAAARTS